MPAAIHTLEGYVVENNHLFFEDKDRNQQLEAQRAQAVVLAMLDQNEQVRVRIASEQRVIDDDPVRYSLITDPWFWVTLHLASRPTHFQYHGGYNEGCYGPQDLRGESQSEAAVLVIAIAVLVCAFVVSCIFTAKHGKEAEKAHQRAREIENYYNSAQDEAVKNIFERALKIQTREWKSQALKTTFTATATIGVVCLTIAAIFALHATLGAAPVSPHAAPLLLAGTTLFASAMVAHGVRSALRENAIDRDYTELNALFEEAIRLHVANPFHILQECHSDRAFIEIGQYRYVKEIGSFAPYRRENLDSQPLGDWEHVEITDPFQVLRDSEEERAYIDMGQYRYVKEMGSEEPYRRESRAAELCGEWREIELIPYTYSSTSSEASDSSFI